MRKKLIKVLIIPFTFLIGVMTAQIFHFLNKKSVEVETPNCVQKENQSKTTKKPDLTYKTPYEIEWSVNHNPHVNLKEAWFYWGIDTEVKGLGNRMFNFAFLEDCSDCTATSFEYDFDGDSQTETLLQIKDDAARQSRFMVFKRTFDEKSNLRWKLVGFIDNDFCKYAMPTHSIYVVNAKTFLVISRNTGATGSGVHTYLDWVYEIDDKGIKEVLRYIAEGHEGCGYVGGCVEGAPLNRSFSAKISNYEKKYGGEYITFDYSVEYYTRGYIGQKDWLSLWVKKQKVVYVRDSQTGMFTFESNKSELMENELEEVYNIDSLTEEGFLRYNRYELMDIAKGNDNCKKEWLKMYLENCEHPPYELKKRIN